MADGKRFEILHKESGWTLETMIIQDTCTGVQYLVLKNGNHVDAVTPLLGRDGKPVITPVSGKE